MLQIQDAHKRFGEKAALDGAAFSLAEGEWLALLGPNGAGKTTLVRAIAGRVKLDSGTIRLQGQEVTGLEHQARASLDVIPQEVALYPNLTARENLEVFAELHGVPRSELRERASWALDWTGLLDRADERSATFSGGMNRRLNIACGILHKPRVILLDEPTVGVDPQSRHRIWEMLEQLRSEGASLLMTTHQLDEAQEVTDRIIILDHGKTIAAGTFKELLNQTIGSGQLVTVTLGETAPEALLKLGFQTDGQRVTRSAENLAKDLPAILLEVESTGATIVDVQVQAPGLQSVFIHLTGRELRE